MEKLTIDQKTIKSGGLLFEKEIDGETKTRVELPKFKEQMLSAGWKLSSAKIAAPVVKKTPTLAEQEVEKLKKQLAEAQGKIAVLEKPAPKAEEVKEEEKPKAPAKPKKEKPAPKAEEVKSK